MAQRVKVADSEPLQVGAYYDFEGTLAGTAPASKTEIYNALKKQPALAPLGFTVIDWGRTKTPGKYIVQVRIDSIPTKSSSLGAEPAAVPIVVWVVGLIVAALVVGGVATYASWKFTELEAYKWDSVPDEQKGPIVALQSAGWQLPLLLVAGAAAVWILSKR